MSDDVINQLTSNSFTGDVNKLFMNSAKNGHTEVVNLLLKNPRVDPGSNNNYAIKWASECGHTEVVKLLLKDSRVDPGDDNNFAIRLASRNGHTEVVKLLLKDSRVDPGDDNNFAIRWASRNGHTEVVKILLSSLKHTFNIITYIEITTGTSDKVHMELSDEIKELLIDHVIKYRSVVKMFLVQHLTTDLASQINHTLVTN